MTNGAGETFAHLSNQLTSTQINLTAGQGRESPSGDPLANREPTDRPATNSTAGDLLGPLEAKPARLYADNRRLAASNESLRIEKALLTAKLQEYQNVHLALLDEVHRLWNSSSWRLLKPLRNLVLKMRRGEKEREPIPASLAEAVETIMAIRQSLSWELTAPLRVIERMLPRHRQQSEANSERDSHQIPITVSASPSDAVGSAAEQHDSQLRAHARQLLKTRLGDFFAAGQLMSLPRAEHPHVSIILVLYNQAEFTLACLSSIVHCLGEAPPCIEVIIADNCSSDETEALLRQTTGATVLRNRTNFGFVKGVNGTATRARGQYLLLLKNGTQLQPGTLEAATRVLDSSPDVGAVGGRVILPDGTLQEAGSIIWNDGCCTGYGRGGRPDAPAYMFRRNVDYCSRVFLLTRRELFERLGGFADAFSPDYYEEADYCMRLREAGFRVVYDPDALVLHLDFGGTEKVDTALKLQVATREAFVRRHQARLNENHLSPSLANVLSARTTNRGKRLLVIDDCVPHPWLGSGSPRMQRIVAELVGTGTQVTFVPKRPAVEDWSLVRSTLPPEVEVMQGYSLAGLGRLLEERQGWFGGILVSRPHNMREFLAFAHGRPDLTLGTTLIYDAEALYTPRMILERRLRGEPVDERTFKARLDEEASLARQADLVLSVSAREAADFQRLGVPDVEVLGVALEPTPGRTPFRARHTLLFVGRLLEEATPNVDAVCWFAKQVLPTLRGLLEEEIRLTVAGANGALSVAALDRSTLTLLGPFGELTPVYDGARVFVAPTRYAAGIPLKVCEAAARGVPSVTTPLLAQQLGWEHERELLVGTDAASFAAQCARLYRDESLWNRLRQNALDRVREDFSLDRFRTGIRRIVDATKPRA